MLSKAYLALATFSGARGMCNVPCWFVISTMKGNTFLAVPKSCHFLKHDFEKLLKVMNWYKLFLKVEISCTFVILWIINYFCFIDVFIQPWNKNVNFQGCKEFLLVICILLFSRDCLLYMVPYRYIVRVISECIFKIKKSELHKENTQNESVNNVCQLDFWQKEEIYTDHQILFLCIIWSKSYCLMWDNYFLLCFSLVKVSYVVQYKQ